MSDKDRRKKIAEAVDLIRTALEQMGEVKQARTVETERRVPQTEDGQTIH